MKNVLILSIFTILCIQANAQWNEKQKIVAQVPGHPFVINSGDEMGKSVAADGDYAIVGAPGSSVSGIKSGVAFIYHYNGSAWVEDQVLIPSDGANSDQFGYSVAISGTTAIVGSFHDNDNGDQSGSAYVFELSGGAWSQVTKLLPSDGTTGDHFGFSVSISGSMAIVGARLDDDSGSDSGSAYIFEKIAGNWIQSTKLTASDGASLDFFGHSVAISGNTALIGAHRHSDIGIDSGSAYIFENNGGAWVQEAKLLASDGAADDYFGFSVAISGNTAIIGAYRNGDFGTNSGSAYIFESTGGSWSQTAKLLPLDGMAGDYFGYAVVISGTRALVGALFDDDNGVDSGSAYVFEFSGGSWFQSNKLLPLDGAVDDRFGNSVAIFGNNALVGAISDDGHVGSAYIFESIADAWVQTVKLQPLDGVAGDQFGYSVAFSGTTAVVGARYDDENGIQSGSVYIFERSGGIWSQTAKLMTSDGVATGDEFGYSVSISGTTVLVGARHDDDNGDNSGSAYVFELSGGTWSQEAKLLASDGFDGDEFGKSVAISGTTAVVGASLNDDNGDNSGSVYVFELSGGTWNQAAKMLPTDGDVGDIFGSSVAISGTTAIVGAFNNDDNGNASGSAYIFESVGGTWSQAAKLLPSDGAINDFFGISVAISGNTALVGAQFDNDNGPQSGSAYVFELLGGTWSQAAKLLPLDGDTLDLFGSSVAISGTKAIVGAYNDGDNGQYAGSAYIFERSGGAWIQADKLLPSDGESDDYFGRSVAISGTTALVSAYWDNDFGSNSGSAYIFSSLLCDLPTITVETTNSSCADLAEGSVIINTTEGTGTFTYSIDGGATTQTENSFSSLIAGNYLAMVIVDGDTTCAVSLPFEITAPPVLIVSCTADTNAACFGDNDGSASVSVSGGIPLNSGFLQLGIDIDGENPNDWSGYSTALSDDGTRVAVGARNNNSNGFESGHVRVYDWNGSTWVQVGNDIDGEASNDHSGNSVSLSSDGQILAIGASDNNGQGTNSGHVRVYEWVGSDWQQKGLDINGESSNDESGHSVSLSSDGLTLAIGAIFNSGNGGLKGHVRVYEWNGSTWLQKGVDINGEGSNDQSGHSVSLSADGLTLAIGAIFNDGNGSNAGHVRVYEWSGSAWVQKGLDIDGESPNDQSGYSVSLSADGQTVAIGAIENNGNNSGHVRVFEFNGGSWLQKGVDIDGEGSGDESGFSVSLSSDGQTLAVGASKNNENGFNAGHVRVYEFSGSAWQQVGSDIDGEASQDRSGFSVSLSADGQIVAVGAPFNNGTGFESGHVRVYDRIGPYAILWSNGNTTATADSLLAGTYTVEVTDANNCTATCEVIILGDTEIPVIFCPSNITDTTAIGDLDLVVNFSDPTATDNCSSVSLVCIPASGSAFPIGTTTVTCTATDGSGNEATCTFDITVEGAASCPTDFNSTGTTDGADFGIFLGNFGLVCSMPPCPTDLNNDGITDGQDFGIFLGNFGLDCP